jgi:hypothetical protein
MATSIPNILQLLSNNGGIAVSNTFKLSFSFNNNSTKLYNNIKSILKDFNPKYLLAESHDYYGISIINTNSASIISLLCDEIDIPGVQFGTSDVLSLYTGVGKYTFPHSKVYGDLTLSWICDANMTPLKFLNGWVETIAGEYDSSNNLYQSVYNEMNLQKPTAIRDKKRSVRFNYPDEYRIDLFVTKAEKGSGSEVGRPSIQYRFDNVYPYAIDATPLSFGSSQLVKITANFYYERWYPLYFDIVKYH